MSGGKDASVVMGVQVVEGTGRCELVRDADGGLVGGTDVWVGVGRERQ